MSTTNNISAGVESLVEVFRCYICMEKLRDARLCPHCSKLCCYPCIRRWLTDQHQQCPHCRVKLHLHDLVNCRWAEEVTTQLDTLKTTEINKNKHEEKDKCELHKEKLTVYCSSCLKCICHQCALFNGSHAGHSFLPLDDVYKTNMSIINEHLKKLKRRHVEFICLIEEIERNVEKIKIGRDERFREIRNFMQTMQIKLDERFKSKFNALNAQHVEFSRETDLIERTLHEIEHRISITGKAEIIDKQKDLLNSIKMIYQKPMRNFFHTPISCNFPSEIIPEYTSRTFIIKNFSIHQQNVDPIYSHSLHINGLTWRLKVYPDGNGTVRGIYLSVFLELINGLNESSKYEYRIEMIHQLSKDSSKNIIREFASDFEIGECWGYNKFFLLDALITEGFIDNDTLILRYQVRPPTYQQKTRDQQWYIKQLENDNEQLNNEIKILREKIQATNLENRIETAIDTKKVNDDDDEYTTLESDEFDSDEDKKVVEGILTYRINRRLISIEQNIHQSNEIPISGAINSNPEVQSQKYDSSLSLITDEDFILADILERSACEQPNTILSNESDNNNTGEFPSYQISLNNLMMLNSQIYQSRIVPPSKSDENQ